MNNRRIKRATRHRIGSSVDDLPEILRGIRRVQGWLEVAAKNNLPVSVHGLIKLETECELLMQAILELRDVSRERNRPNHQ